MRSKQEHRPIDGVRAEEASGIPLGMVLKMPDATGDPEGLQWIEPPHRKPFAIAPKVYTVEHTARIQQGLDRPAP